MNNINHDYDKNTKKHIKIGIFGEPNVGKSTLINKISDFRSCMVSNTPHTTKDLTFAAVTSHNCQIIFVDTPGISTSSKKEITLLNNIAYNADNNTDLNLFLFDPKQIFFPIHLIELSKKLNKTNIAIINKIDCVTKGKLLPYTAKLAPYFKNILYISAYKGDGLNYLKSFLFKYCNKPGFIFEAQNKTNRDYTDLIIDRVQEVLFSVLKKEIPHQIGIQILPSEKFKNGSELFKVNLLCKRSHKIILVGHIKELSSKIRKNIEVFLDKKTHIQLNVLVRKIKI